MTYVRVGDVQIWYERRGDGEPLVLMHGGMSNGADLLWYAEAFAAHFRVYLPDRRGHGRTPDVPGPMTYELMAQDTIAFLDQIVGGPAHLMGHSDGATVALITALRRPDLVRTVVSVSGHFHHDGIIPGTVDVADDVATVGDTYARLSPDGRDHLPVVAAKVARMWVEEPTLTPPELGGIAAPTLVMSGDDDVISLEHTVALFRALPRAELAVMPGTSHELVSEKPELCAMIIRDFLAVGSDSRRHTHA